METEYFFGLIEPFLFFIFCLFMRAHLNEHAHNGKLISVAHCSHDAWEQEVLVEVH